MQTEFINALRTILTNDGTLAGLLGESYAVYRNQIPDLPPYPCVRIWFPSDGPQRDNSATGVFKPQIQIDIYSGDPLVESQIADRIDELLEVPRNRASRIESDNYKCDLMYREDANLRFPNVRQDDVKIEQLVTQWRATVIKKSVA